MDIPVGAMRREAPHAAAVPAGFGPELTRVLSGLRDECTRNRTELGALRPEVSEVFAVVNDLAGDLQRLADLIGARSISS